MSVKIIHTADLHIGRALPYLSNRAAARRSEVLLTLQKICELCKSENADALIIAGDLFESVCPEVSLAEQTFNILGNANLPVVICAGNHDCLLCDSPYFTQKLPENITVLTKETPFVKINDQATVYGVSFYDYEMSMTAPPALPDESGINILALHADLDTESRYNPINADFLSKCGADYVALGHIHKRSEIKQVGNTHFAYCGCPEGQGFDELSVCGVYSVNLEKGSCKAEFLPTSKRVHAFEKIDITDCADNLEVCRTVENALKEKFGENFAGNLYKIHLVGTKSFAVDTAFITESLSQSLYYVKLADKTSPKINLEVLAKEPTLKGIFVRRMIEKMDTCNEKELPLYKQALKLGLEAFDGEVIFDED